MEIRDWCIQILGGQTLEDKLLDPLELTDINPGPPLIWDIPSRPPNMEFKKHSRKEKLPAFHEHGTQDNRAVCLHRFAGHELLAVEIMAYALLAFPEAPPHFRKGLSNTLKEEQGHVRLYVERLAQLGVRFGDLPLYKYFWAYTPFLQSPLKYISVMSLTFEMANLDFAPMYGQSFLRNGDIVSSQLMQQILEDEIKHVSFGMHWLKKIKDPLKSEWDSWRENTTEFLPLKRARGFRVFEQNRQKAGIPEDWIAAMKKS